MGARPWSKHRFRKVWRHSDKSLVFRIPMDIVHKLHIQEGDWLYVLPVSSIPDEEVPEHPLIFVRFDLGGDLHAGLARDVAAVPKPQAKVPSGP